MQVYMQNILCYFTLYSDKGLLQEVGQEMKYRMPTIVSRWNIYMLPDLPTSIYAYFDPVLCLHNQFIAIIVLESKLECACKHTDKCIHESMLNCQ